MRFQFSQQVFEEKLKYQVSLGVALLHVEVHDVTNSRFSQFSERA